MPSSTQVEYLSSPTDGHFDYESDPIQAMNSYAKMMHMHTKQQMDAATTKCRRSSSDDVTSSSSATPMNQSQQQRQKKTIDQNNMHRHDTKERMDIMMEGM